jgi:hypothetical protein
VRIISGENFGMHLLRYWITPGAAFHCALDPES